MACRITDELLVRKSEHNDEGLTNLEEISLHQQHICRLEYINRVCAKLKILLLQDNCIPKIENLGRMRSLEYLNLAMNNIETIENLECCEALQKLDLTLNFIGDLQSVTKLKENFALRELTLMGNPCSRFDGYREYVIGTLDQLKSLDGQEISKRERKAAKDNLCLLIPKIVEQEDVYFRQRKLEKEEAEADISKRRLEYENPDLTSEEQRRIFYNSSSKHTPEYRLESSRKIHEFSEQDARDRDPFRDEEWDRKQQREKSRPLFDPEGRPLNVNQPGIDFHYDDSDSKYLKVQLKTYKHLDSSLIELDLQPKYLRAVIKGKIFQLRFLEEIYCDSSKAERSKVTGHLTITMPKVKPLPSPKIDSKKGDDANQIEVTKKLEVSEPNFDLDFCKIVTKLGDVVVTDDDVPPLEEIE